MHRPFPSIRSLETRDVTLGVTHIPIKISGGTSGTSMSRNTNGPFSERNSRGIGKHRAEGPDYFCEPLWAQPRLQGHAQNSRIPRRDLLASRAGEVTISPGAHSTVEE